MNKLFYFILAIALFSCGNGELNLEDIETSNLSQTQIDSILTAFNFQYSTPITLDNSEEILIPISTSLLERKTSFSKDGYYVEDYPRYWNVLFYNRATGNTKLLTDKKFRISEIIAKHHDYAAEQRILNGKILYIISDIDYNQDDKLNSLDPEFLYVSDFNGANFLKISPPNENLVYHEIIPESQEIIFETRRDTNEDLVFNNEDELIWYKTTLENNEWTTVEIVDSLDRRTIENLYFEQWLKKK